MKDILVEAIIASTLFRREERPQRYQLWIIALADEVNRLRKHVCDLPDSIKEALNSGDGVYRP